jgi:hypothetical protein
VTALVSDAEPLALALQRSAQIAELVLDDVVDSLPRVAQEGSHLALDRFASGRLFMKHARHAAPSEAERGGRSARAHDEWPAPGWTTSKQQRSPDANRDAQQRGGQQIVWAIKPSRLVSPAGGRADAGTAARSCR